MWRPKTYQEYFLGSPLPGGGAAVKLYERLDPNLRRRFEAAIARLDAIAERSILTISEKRSRHGELTAEHVQEFCEETSSRLRQALEAAADLVNHGDAPAGEASQQKADRLLRAAHPV
ncbi:MAG: hypothetical protein NW215_05395 [Hyphomicrobiales bacterium]|nr:hypothetical protein [Hyphomicrobiales bacterium]